MYKLDERRYNRIGYNHIGRNKWMQYLYKLVFQQDINIWNIIEKKELKPVVTEILSWL